MNQAVLFNIVGTSLIVLAVILHIVCLSSPYYAEADMNDLGKDIAKMVKDNPTLVGPQKAEDMPQIMEAFKAMQGNINFGMWKVCILTNQSGIGLDLCMDWDTETTFSEGNTGTVESLVSDGWIRGAQAMSIIGTLVAVVAVALALINIISRSKGDRLRLLYIFIALTCIGSGILILIGDLIMASNYPDVFDPVMTEDRDPLPPPQFINLFKDQFYLSWGFALDVVAVALAFLAALAHLMGGRVALSTNGVV